MTRMAGGQHILRDMLIVAGQELAESIRTRRAVLLLILFCGGTVVGTWAFTSFLRTVESQLVAALGLDAGATGGATAVLWKSPFFRHVMINMAGHNTALAEALLQFTPLGLFFAWLAMSFGPWLVTLSSSGRMAEDIWSGSARFVLCRTTRLAWMCGMFLGQAALLLVALLLSGLAAWLTGLARMEVFSSAATLRDVLLFVPKAWVYGLAFLGLVSAVSMCCRSPGVANALGVAALLAVTAVYFIARHYAGAGWRRVFDGVQLVLPNYHYFDLMRPDWNHALPAAMFLLALGLVYLLLGYARLVRRDL
ncbi:MAG: ABC transporter permease subunit [Kiritimatiellaeota bacterium]|nr:ABC transporter permease subunit [Kiritimatiellota bacterium]